MRYSPALPPSNLVDICSEEELDLPGVKDIANEDAARKQVGKIMGVVLKTANEVVIEGYRVQRQTEGGRNAADNWVETKRYTFTRLNPGVGSS